MTAIRSHVGADEPPQAGDAPAASAGSSGQKWALLIVGHPGDQEHDEAFSDVVQRIGSALENRFGFASQNIWMWSGSGPSDPAAETETSRGPATRETLQNDIKELRRRVHNEDELWVFVLGHAHYADRAAYFNVPGTDFSAEQLGEWLAPFDCRHCVFFLTTPLSGYFVKPLAKPGRVVIAATGADLENNETLYPSSLARLLETFPQGDGHDLDQDGMHSLLDLYLAVTRDVQAQYDADDLLPTEHAQLDDNGDGRGSELQIEVVGKSSANQARRSARRRATGDGELSRSIDVGGMVRQP